MEQLAGAVIFSRFDIRQGFHQMRLEPEQEDLSSFHCRLGTYKYWVLPFGLTGGPASFQQYISQHFLDCMDFVTIYMDDLLIFSHNLQEHQEHMQKVLKKLEELGLQISLKKSEFHIQTTKYLGYIISPQGIAVDPAKISVIKDWEPLKTL